MDVSNEIIKRILEDLVSPEWNGIVKYEVETSTHDDTGVLHHMIDVIFDVNEYWKTYHSGEYDSFQEMDSDISVDVKKAVKYLGIYNSIVEIILNEDGDNHTR
jgi:uncharacterized protein YaiE (UPF0345 family)